MNEMHSTRSRIPQWLLFGLMAAALCLPWIVNSGASLTLNAYDLAEWTSLHPTVRASVPPLFLSFALRALWVFLGAMIAFAPASQSVRLRWFKVLLLLVMAVALLPPIEFFSSALGDLNYRQQFALSLMLLAIGGVSLIRRLNQVHKLFQLTAAGLGIVFSLLGLILSQGLMQAFGLPAQVGLGSTLFMVFCGTLIAFRKQTR